MFSLAAAKSLQSCPTLCNPIDGSPSGSPSLGFSRQEYWSGLPFQFSVIHVKTLFLLEWFKAGFSLRHSGSDGKASACNAGDPGSIPGSGRSPGEGNGNPLQYSCLENPMEGGAWWAAVHVVAKSRTQLNN